MRKILLLAGIMPALLTYAQGTTENRLIGSTRDAEITFYTADFADFETNTLDYHAHAIALNPADSLLYGLINEDEGGTRNLYKINPFTGELELIFEFEVSYFNSADIGSDGKVYMITGNGDGTPGLIYSLDAVSGDFELVYDTELEGPFGLEYNTLNNSLYIFQSNAFDVSMVHRYDLATGDFTSNSLAGGEDLEIHGAYFIEEENQFVISEYYGEITATTTEEYDNLEPYFTSTYATLDHCHIQLLRAEALSIDMEACPGDDSTRIELLYEVNDVEWYLNGEIIDGEEDDFIYAKNTGYYQARVQIGESDNYMLSESIVVEFYTVPSVELSQEMDDHLICPGETIIIDGAAPGGGEVQWYLNGDPIVDATSSSYEATSPGVYNQIKTNLSGCSDSAAVSFVIEPDAGPEVELSLDGDEYLCPDEIITLTGIDDGEIQWYLNGELIDDETDISIDITESGVYNQFVINELGCADSAAVGITILSADNPTVEITTPAEDLILCPDETILLEGTTGESYQWFLNGDELAGETDSDHEATIFGHYNLIVTNEFGCSDSTETGVTIEAGETPFVEISNEFDDHLICSGETIVLEGIAGAELQWYKDGDIIAGETGTTYNATEIGSYNLMITNEGGCSNFSEVDYVIEEDTDCGLSIIEDEELTINVYPNPVKDILSIESVNNLKGISIYDITGHVVYENRAVNTTNTTVNFSELAGGIYLVHLLTEKGTKIVKVKH